MYKRDQEIVAQIDQFITENYPEHGPDYCAKQLNLDRRYVQERAWKNKVSYLKKKKTSGTKQTTKEKIKELETMIVKLKYENYQLKKKAQLT